ncbi:MAG: inositol monophosphatase [Ruminococcaceae bacterium]|nr:inositol monophosphatase [Oscillospiraceae bacterium]
MYQQIETIVKEAGRIILGAHHIERSVEEKTSACDLVTAYDTAVQEYLRKALLTAYPQFGFYGEENDCCETEGKCGWFIVDPIDGTANFIRKLHHSCVSIGLLVEGKMEYGAVYNPYFDELFTAQRGKGAFLNGERIHVTDVAMNESMLLFGSAIYYRETIPATLRFVEELFPQTLDFRRGGSAALDLCYVAAGRADVYFECCIRPWDYAAGSLIAQEAGAIVTALDGSPLRFADRCSVAAGNPKNYAQLIELSKKIAAEPDMKGRIL